MEVQPCAPVPRRSLMGGREERRLHAAKFHLPRIQQPSSWPPRALTSMSLFSPVSAAFPGFPSILVTLMDRVTPPFLSKLVLHTSHRKREVQRQADDACNRLVVLSSHHRREVQLTPFPALAPASSSLLPLIPDALLGWPRKNTGFA